MREQAVEQLVRFGPFRDEAVEVEHRPERQRVAVRVEEAAAADALEQVAREQVRRALVVGHVEPVGDGAPACRRRP